MKVKDILKHFKEKGYKPNTEVAIAWWEKNLVEAQNETELTDEEWSDVVADIEDREWCDVNEDITAFIQELKEE